MHELNELDTTNLAEWNHSVRGFMRLWDIAAVIGVTPCLEHHLEGLPEGDMVKDLAQTGNCRETYMQLLLLSLRALLAEEPHRVGTFPDPNHEEQLMLILDRALIGSAFPFLKQLPGYAELEGRSLYSMRG